MSAKIRGGRGSGPKDNEIVLGFTNDATDAKASKR